MKKNFFCGLLVAAMMLPLYTQAEVITRLTVARDNNGKFDFVGLLKMDIFDVRKYNKRDIAVVEVEVFKNGSYVDGDSNGKDLYVDKFGW